MQSLKLKVVLIMSLLVVFLFGSFIMASAHFGMIIPSDDMVAKDDEKTLN